MNLYGQDMDEQVSPYEAALGWTVMLDEGRNFIGRNVLEQQKTNGVSRQMIGLLMDEKGVLRHGQKVLTAQGEGHILSGTFSPTLNKAIGFARVPAGKPSEVRVNIRDREIPVRVVRFPFVREGQTQPNILIEQRSIYNNRFSSFSPSPLCAAHCHSRCWCASSLDIDNPIFFDLCRCWVRLSTQHSLRDGQEQGATDYSPN